MSNTSQTYWSSDTWRLPGLTIYHFTSIFCCTTGMLTGYSELTASPTSFFCPVKGAGDFYFIMFKFWTGVGSCYFCCLSDGILPGPESPSLSNQCLWTWHQVLWEKNSAHGTPCSREHCYYQNVKSYAPHITASIKHLMGSKSTVLKKPGVQKVFHASYATYGGVSVLIDKSLPSVIDTVHTEPHGQ